MPSSARTTRHSCAFSQVVTPYTVRAAIAPRTARPTTRVLPPESSSTVAVTAISGTVPTGMLRRASRGVATMHLRNRDTSRRLGTPQHRLPLIAAECCSTTARSQLYRRNSRWLAKTTLPQQAPSTARGLSLPLTTVCSLSLQSPAKLKDQTQAHQAATARPTNSSTMRVLGPTTTVVISKMGVLLVRFNAALPRRLSTQTGAALT